MALSLSHGGGETVYSSSSNSNQVLVGTLDGVTMIERSGAGWGIAYQALQGKHIHALVFEEGSETWFAGIRHGGIMVSTDGGKSWEPSDHGLTEKDVYCLSKARPKGRAESWELEISRTAPHSPSQAHQFRTRQSSHHLRQH